MENRFKKGRKVRRISGPENPLKKEIVYEISDSKIIGNYVWLQLVGNEDQGFAFDSRNFEIFEEKSEIDLEMYIRDEVLFKNGYGMTLKLIDIDKRRNNPYTQYLFLILDRDERYSTNRYGKYNEAKTFLDIVSVHELEESKNEEVKSLNHCVLCKADHDDPCIYTSDEREMKPIIKSQFRTMMLKRLAKSTFENIRESEIQYMKKTEGNEVANYCGYIPKA